MAAPSSSAAAPAAVGATPADQRLLQSRLISLFESLTHLRALLAMSHAAAQGNPSAPSLPPYQELLNRYNALLSQLVGVGDVLSSQRGMNARPVVHAQDQWEDAGRPKEKKEERDTRMQAWSNALVHPVKEVEESRDWVTGALLRTKQTPEVEAHQAELIASMPPTFQLSNPSHNSFHTSFRSLGTALADKVDGWRGEFDFKMRLGPGDGVEMEDSDDEEEEKEEEPVIPQGRSWTMLEVAAYQRTGHYPDWYTPPVPDGLQQDAPMQVG